MNQAEKQQDFSKEQHRLARKRALNFWEENEEEILTSATHTANSHGSLPPINLLQTGRIKAHLQARCVWKGRVTEFCHGKLISFHVMDTSDEISMVAFGKTAETANNTLEVNGCYDFEDFVVTSANDLKYKVGHTGLQITIDERTIIKNIDDSLLPAIPIQPLTVEEIKGKERGEVIDCLVLVLDGGYVTQVGKNSKKKRDVVVTDGSKKYMDITLWNSEAESFRGEFGTVYAENPNLSSAEKLKSWFRIEKEKKRSKRD